MLPARCACVPRHVCHGDSASTPMSLANPAAESPCELAALGALLGGFASDTVINDQCHGGKNHRGTSPVTGPVEERWASLRSTHPTYTRPRARAAVAATSGGRRRRR